MAGLVQFRPWILQQQTNTGGASIGTSDYKGSVSIAVLQIDIYFRMNQEDGDNGVMAIIASNTKGGPASSSISPIYIEIGVLAKNLLHLFHIAILGGEVKTGWMHRKGIEEGDVLCPREPGRAGHREI